MSVLPRPEGIRMAPEANGLVQRTGALEACEQAFDSVNEAGALLVFEGAAGSGRSALLASACRRAKERGFLVLRAAGSDSEQRHEFGLLRRLLDTNGLENAGNGAGDVVARTALEAGRILDPRLAAPSEPDPATSHALFRLVVGLASVRPLMIAIDDLEQADEATLHFLEYLGVRSEGLPLVVAATLNPPGDAFGRESAHLLLVEQMAAVHRLEALDELGVEQLLSSRGRVASAIACRELAWLTGGNPFLLCALIEHLGSGDGTRLERCRELDPEALLPPRVMRSVGARLAQVGPDAQQLARAAAVLGHGSAVLDAARMLDVEPARALGAADALAAAGVLENGGELCFAQPLLAIAIRELVPDGERSRLARRAAAALWLRGAPPSEVAAHLLQSNGYGDSWAAEALRAAAGDAPTDGHRLALLRRALCEQPPGRLRAELLIDLAAIDLRGSGTEAARQLAEAVDLLAPGPDRVHACERLGQVLWGLGRFEEAGRAFASGLDGLGSERRSVASRLSAGLMAARRLAPGLGIPAPRPPDETRIDEPAMLAQVALERALGRGGSAHVAELAERALEPGRLLDQQTCCGPAFQAALCVLVLADEPEAVERALAQALECGEGRRVAPARAVLLELRAVAALRSGRLAEAEFAAKAAAASVPAVLPLPVPAPRAVLAEIDLVRARLAGAREHAEAALAAASEAMDSSPAGAVQHALALSVHARVRLAQGEPEAALAELLDCGRRLRELGLENPAVVAWRSHAAAAALRLEQRERAAALAAEELELARAFGARRPLGVALRSVAVAAAPGRRVQGMREAIAVLGGTPARLERAHALAELGSELHRSGRRRAAREPLRAALDIAQSCQAAALAERAKRDLLAAGARPRRLRTSGLGSLTPRERQVSELAATGQSNRTIAGHLVVSEKTVEWHLANAYRKLEVRGRPGLAELFAGE